MAPACLPACVPPQGDPEMAEFAREEIAELQKKLGELETKLKVLLLPK